MNNLCEEIPELTRVCIIDWKLTFFVGEITGSFLTKLDKEIARLLIEIFPAIPLNSAAGFAVRLTQNSGRVSPYKGSIDIKIRLCTKLWIRWNTECVELHYLDTGYRSRPSWMFYHFLCKLDFHNLLQVKPAKVPLGIASLLEKMLRLRRLLHERYASLCGQVRHRIQQN